MRYSVDTSALLDGWRRYYPPDVFPALWTKLEALIDAGELMASEEVLLELKKRDDDVYAWASKLPDMFQRVDERIQPLVVRLLRDYPKLVDTRTNRSAADPFVIALAMLEQCTVVTGERATNVPDRPNIPDVCSAMGVRCISLLQLIREQGWVFHP